MSSCLPPEQLRQLLDGELAAEAEQAANAHIEVCSSCQAHLEALTAVSLVPSSGRSRPRQPQAPSTRGTPRARLSDDQLHRLRNLLPSSGQETPIAVGNQPAPPEDWPQVLGYEVLRELGRGGMAVVYEALHLRLNRKVALKMIRSGDLATPEQLVRFCAEGEILAGLRHPNIVQIYEVGTHGKQPYMALELMEGGSLAEALAGKPMRPRPAAELAETIARAMAYAHEQGIVHRDLNPANILLASPAQVTSHKLQVTSKTNNSPLVACHLSPDTTTPKVTDFGLAKHRDHDSRLTRTGHVMGTPSYMAPEQVHGKPDAVGPLADVYALGVILYEALAGRPPFQAPTTLEVMNQITELEPVPPSRLLPGVPRDLEVICLKCLEKAPERRYQGAGALADDLRRFLDGLPIQARRVATVERAWRWAKRRPAVAGLLLGVVLALLAGTGVSSYFGIKAQRRARDAENAGEETRRALEAAQAARRQSDLRTAELQFRTGLQQCEAGAIDRGLFTLLEAWRSAPDDAIAFRRVIRTNLAAWGRQLPVLEQMLPHPHPGLVLARFVGAEGKALVTWDREERKQVVRWDVTTGQPLGPPFLVPDGELAVEVNPEGTLLTTERQAGSRLRDLATGRLLSPEFQHHAFDQSPLWGLALFCEPRRVLVTKSTRLGVEEEFRVFWQVPPPSQPTEPVQPLLTVRLAPGETYHVTTTADGRPVAVVFRQQPGAAADEAGPRAEFWDLGTGKQLPALPKLTRSDPRISWDGRTIFSVNSPETWGHHTGADGAVRWWDTLTGRQVGEPWRPHRPAQHAVLTADGQLLVTRGHDHQVRLFDLARGLQRGGDIPTTGFPEQEYALRVGASPDGTRIATPSRDGVVRLWQARHTLPQATTVATPRAPVSLLPHLDTGTLSSDGRMGALRGSGMNDGGRLLTASAEPLATLLRQRNLYHCAFSPDGATIATAPHNVQWGGQTVVTLWDKAGRSRGLSLPQYRYINCLAFSPDGRTLAVGCVGGVFLWDVTTGRLLHLLRETSTAGELVFSPDGTRLAVAYVNGWRGVGAGVRLWDTGSGQPVGAFLAERHPRRLRPYSVMAFAESGQALRVFDFITGKLYALDTRTGAVRQPPLVLAPAEEAVFSADGAALATGHSNGSVQQWGLTTGHRAGPPLELPHLVTRMRYSPDGQFLAIACRDQSVRLWDAAICAPLGPPLLHQATVLDLRFSPDGTSLVTMTATGRLHTWPLPQPVADNPERMELWLKVSGGVSLENNTIVLLDAEAWRRCRGELQERWPAADPALPRPIDEADWHDARARDAEEDGNLFAALWHLGRLSLLRSQDWRPPARQGLLHAQAGDLGQAESAYRLVAQRAPAEALRGWHRQNAATCLAQKQWSMALHHLDWLVAAGGEDWQAHADRATALGHLGPRAEAEAARERAVKLGADAAFLVSLAEEKAAQGRWLEAAALFARADERGGLDVLDTCNHAMICLKSGDEAGYQRICTHLVHDLGNDGPRTAAFRRGSVSNILGLFRVCLLRADAVPDWQPLLTVAEEILAVPMRELALAPEGQLVTLRQDWLAARGAVLCRQGRYRAAISSLRESLGPDGKAGSTAARAFLALAHLRLNERAEARRWLDTPLAPPVGARFSWSALETELLRPPVDELRKEIKPPVE